MVKLSIVLVMTAVAAAGVLFATGVHHAIQKQGPNPRIVAMYNEFKAKYGKLRATPSEDNFRLRVFEKNIAHIEEVNKRALGYSFAVNDFADMEKDEFAAKYYGLGWWKLPSFNGIFGGENVEPEFRENPQVVEQPAVQALSNNYPKDKDWSDMMHPIENQRSCASCYAFSTVAPLELAQLQKFGTKIKLSIQELVDCSDEFGNNGCRGGWMHQSYDYILKKGELSMEAAYPYMGVDNEFCRLDKSKVKDLLKGHRTLQTHKPSEILEHLQTTVVPSAVDCSGLLFYSSGVFQGDCSSNINHAIVIVGYGVAEDGSKYWKIRNSWGETWGESGYLRLKREDQDGVEGKCGITNYNVVTLQ